MTRKSKRILVRAAMQMMTRKSIEYDVTPAKALEFMYVLSPSYIFKHRDFDQWLYEICGVSNKSELGV